MTDVISYSVLSLAALYAIYRLDPEHADGKCTSIWSFYSSVVFCEKRTNTAQLLHSQSVSIEKDIGLL